LFSKNKPTFFFIKQKELYKNNNFNKNPNMIASLAQQICSNQNKTSRTT